MRVAVSIAVAFVSLAQYGCKSEPPAPPAAETSAAPAPASAVRIDPARLSAFAPLPDTMLAPEQEITEEQITLGRILYFETRLSAGKDVSCNTCHGLDTYGVDGKKVSEGHKKQLGTRNSPTVYNAAGHFAQFWDGRSTTIEEQAKLPILNPVEMAMPNEKAVVKALKAIPEYAGVFKQAFPGEKDPITFDNVAKAIGAFERKLVTPDRWDKFLKGDAAVLTDEEKKGFNLFVDTGCTTCHTGPYVGGDMFQKLGLLKPWPDQKDQGRFEETKQEADRMFFKVPGLRNIEKTGPYFHDGSEPSLANAVVMMARHQLDTELTPADAESIVAWLKTLTGELPNDYIAQPTLAAKK